MASFFNKKAGLWISGRKKSSLKPLKQKSIWMHCASLGEFEQGRPVLEAIKKIFPEYPIVLSFFSPSGYEIRKNYPLADLVTYLPLDTPENAEKFVNDINPALVLWIKYEYWLNHLAVLKKKEIPVLLISGHFRTSQPFFKWYGKIWKAALSGFEHLFVQHQSSINLLQQIDINSKATVSGDTRFDRVSEIALNPVCIPEIESFSSNNQVIVAGSTWPRDEIILSTFLQKNPEYKLIVVPHEVNEKRIKELISVFPSAVLFTEYKEITNCTSRIMIVDAIGILSSIYQYAAVSYIGGGFNKGIHNTLEAAVYGKPVVFGPNYQKFREAVEMIEAGCAFPVENENDLYLIAQNFLRNETHLKAAGEKAKAYVSIHSGATKHIMDYVKSNLLFTK